MIQATRSSLISRGAGVNPQSGRNNGRSGHVGGANLDEFDEGKLLKKKKRKDRIPNGKLCPQTESEPREGKEVKATEVCAQKGPVNSKLVLQNHWEPKVSLCNAAIAIGLEVLQPWRCRSEVF